MKQAVRAAAAFLLVLAPVLVPVAGPAGSAAAEGRFIDELGDVPLMAGFEVDPESIVEFDTPSGRIVRLRARGRVPVGEAHAFYRRTLPNLGWRPTEEGYTREAETLTVAVERTDGETIIRFALAPAAK